MKIMTIFGTRPEIIRLSLIVKKLDSHCEHIMVHTGQNYDTSLSDIFLSELRIRDPDEFLGVKEESFGAQIGRILETCESVIAKHKPDKILILGDTNSALAAIVAARMGIPVFHMEAGNRCFDDRVPEEVNRRVIDHASTILMPYTSRSKENLIQEGIERERIYVTGNPIFEVLEHYRDDIGKSDAMDRLEVEKNGFFLATLHRAENVDHSHRLKSILDGFAKIVAKYKKPLLISVHPRTAEKIKKFEIDFENSLIRPMEPLGLFDFVKLEKNAFAVLTDSGTVQEECAIFRVPNVTVRDVTERPETLECGSNIVSGAEATSIAASVDIATSERTDWVIPQEYLVPSVSDAVIKILLGFTSIRKHYSQGI